MNISKPAIERPIATTLLTLALLLAGGLAYYADSGIAAAANRFPGDFGRRFSAGSQSGDHGFRGGDSAGAAIRPHRRHQSDDLQQPAWVDRHHHAVRPEP